MKNDELLNVCVRTINVLSIKVNNWWNKRPASNIAIIDCSDTLLTLHQFSYLISLVGNVGLNFFEQCDMYGLAASVVQ